MYRCEAETDAVTIQQNLGHTDVKTTLGYIDTLGADRRWAPTGGGRRRYSFDLSRLAEVEV